MKKLTILIVLLVMAFTVGCSNKPAAVKDAEEQIKKIGTVSIESWDEIEAAENTLKSLGDSDYELVDNKRSFEQAKKDFEALITDLNDRIENARYLADNDAKDKLLFKNVSKGLDTIKEIRSELPDEVVEKYIVFKSDKTIDEWIDARTQNITDCCYPNTTVLKFDLWYQTVTDNLIVSTDSNAKTYTYTLYDEKLYNPGLDYDSLQRIEDAYGDYIKDEGFKNRVTCSWNVPGDTGIIEVKIP